MKKTIIILICLFFIVSFILINSLENKLKTKCIYPSICIYNPNLNSLGSGVVVRSERYENFYYNVAITCQHILNEDERINPIGYFVKIPIFRNSKIIYYNEYPCVIYERNKEYDLAIIVFLSNESMDCAEIDFNCNLDLDDKIMKIGYGLGDDLRIDHGNITSISGKLNEHKNLYRMNAFAIFGDSGGPVFYNYKLVGITNGIRSLGQNCLFNISFASSIKNLKNWQKELNNIEFVYNKNKELPSMPVYILEFNNWSIK
jgi:hypothetical protein